jgi:hypothetical protein
MGVETESQRQADRGSVAAKIKRMRSCASRWVHGRLLKARQVTMTAISLVIDQ